MGQQCIVLFISVVWIIGVLSEEDRKFSVTIDTVKINEDHGSIVPTPTPHQVKVQEEEQEDIDKENSNKYRALEANFKDELLRHMFYALSINFNCCCGVKPSLPSIRSTEPIIRNGDYDGRINGERTYGPRFGSRPEERYGWQNVNAVRPSNAPDRYNQRPSNSDNNYSGTTRPGTAYGGNYGDNRPHGSAIYGTKPGGYGVSGSLGEASEFGGPDTHGYQEAAAPAIPPGINIQTQKAVALKALAGVALIGAAAALATNPVLMPLGVISGRRKRSDTTFSKNNDANYPLKIFDDFISRMKQENGEREFSVTPHCVARLACEVQRDYIADLKKNEEILSKDKSVLHSLEVWFINLIRRNILDVDYVSSGLKKLIKLAISVGSENRDCKVFSCNLVKN